jgi:hypothetical protein
MKVAFASIYQPQSKGVVERANSLIFEAIKKILEGEKKSKWAEVMPIVVWSHNTTMCRATNFTPYRGSATRGDKIPNLENCNRDRRIPK